VQLAFSKTKIVISIAVLVVIGGVAYLQFGRSSGPTYETTTAIRGTITQTVDVTGHVEAATDVTLAFERGGRVAEVLVKVGDHVKKNAPLVRLEAATQSASIAEARAAVASATAHLGQYQAALDTAQAQLAELKQGSTQEQIQLAKTQVSRAEQTVSDARVSLANTKVTATTDLANGYGDAVDALHEAYREADDAVNKQIDDFFTDDASNNPKLSFVTADSQAQIDSEQGRLTSGIILASLQSLADVSVTDQAAVDSALIAAAAKLSTIRDFLSRLNDTINVSTSLSAANQTSYRTSLNTARSNVNTAISSVTGVQQAIAAQKASNTAVISKATAVVSDAEQALAVAKDQLSITLSGPTAEQLAAKEAAVRQAEASVASQKAEIDRANANLASADAEYGKSILRSPIDGVVTARDVTAGEIVASSASAIALISEATFEIKSYVPEADIAKVHVGDTATVTLDAYGDEVAFDATISSIDPAETVIEGVSTYRVVLQFTTPDERVRSGMTANVTIMSGTRTDAIIIPQRAVFTDNGQRAVRVLKNGLPETVQIETGLRGSTGNIEVTSGISEGDQIIVNEIKN